MGYQRQISTVVNTDAAICLPLHAVVRGRYREENRRRGGDGGEKQEVKGGEKKLTGKRENWRREDYGGKMKSD